MQVKPFFRAFAAAVVLAALSAVASAQVTQLSGKVTLRQADGTEVPVQNAVVDIYRTDIAGKWQVKTDRKGTYLHAGLPFVGTFTIAASAPNARPSFQTNIRVSQRPVVDFTLEAGDGMRLTLEDIKKYEAGAASPAAGAAGGAAATGRGESAEDKARREELERRAKEIEEQKAKFAGLNNLVKSGNDAFTAKKYEEAIGFFDQGIQAAPDEPVFYRNKAVALRARAVDQYNTAAGKKDAAGRETARTGLKQSVENMEKALELFRANSAKEGAAAPTPGNDELSYLTDRQESYRLALMTTTQVDTQAAVKAFQEYIAAESDEAKKMKAQSSLGESLFQSGQVDEAISTFRAVLASSPNNLDAMYGLGIALASKVTDATQDAALLREARDLMQGFISKAPDTHPKKQDAVASAQYIEDTMKSASAPKPSESRPARRRP